MHTEPSASPGSAGRERLRTFGLVAAVACAYFLGAQLGFSLNSITRQVSLVWPPSGIALAALLVLGFRVWPGVLIGAFVANVLEREPTWVAAGIAAGNTLEGLIGAYLIRRASGGRHTLSRVRDVLWLVGGGAILATLVSATIGVFSLRLGGIATERPLDVWVEWWVGDAVSMLIVAPLLMTLDGWRGNVGLKGRGVEAIVLGASMVSVAALVFLGGGVQLEYIVFPFVIWAALRFAQPLTSFVVLIGSGIAILGCAHRIGPFVAPTWHESLLLLQLFNGTVAMTALVLAAQAAERASAERHRATGFVVARILAGTREIDRAIERILTAVCQGLNWDIGAVWRFDAARGELRCGGIWSRDGVSATGFEALSRTSRFAPGVGLPGRVFSSKASHWIDDVRSDENFPRRFEAARDRIQTAFGFPLLLGEGCIGVIEFFSREALERDDLLLEMMATFGSQIGQLVAREQSDVALRRSEERFALAQRANKVGTFDWNLESGAIEWTREMEELFALAPGAFGGTLEAWTEAIHDEDRETFVAAIARARHAHEDLRIEVRPRRVDPARWIALIGSVLLDADQRAARVLGVGMDVTEKRSAEDSLRDADRRKNEFLAMLAHELRNPLAPILNSMSILKLAPQDPDRITQARAIVERQARHMARLVDDLLDVSRLSRGKIQLRLEAIALEPVVEQAIETCRPFIDGRGHALEVHRCDEPLFVRADAARLAQVLCNLLDNAAKFTESAGCIRLSMTADERFASITVEDDGRGIPADVLPTVFEMFTQGQNGIDRATGGLGVGLALAKTLVEMHGGSIEAASAGRNRGSTFVVRLPRIAAPDAAPSRALPADSQSLRRRILVVDDHRDCAATLGAILRMKGHEVEIAYDGVAALEAAAGFRPEVALLDLGLPGLDGYAVARALRREPGDRGRIRLIAISGYASDEYRARSTAAGFDAHLAKPVDTDLLFSLIGENASARA